MYQLSFCLTQVMSNSKSIIVPLASLLVMISLFAVALLTVEIHREQSISGVAANCSSSQENVTITLRTPTKLLFFKPHVTDAIYERHVTVQNITQTEPMVISMTRNDNKKTIFVMRFTMQHSAAGQPYLSIWMT